MDIAPITPEEAFSEGGELFWKRVAECVAAFNREIIDQASQRKYSDTLQVHFSGGCDMDQADPSVLKKVGQLFESAGWRVLRTDVEFWSLRSVFAERRVEAA